MSQQDIVAAIERDILPQIQQKPQPKTGFFANLGAGYESLKGDIGSIGAGFGVPGAEAYARSQQKLASEKATMPEFSDIAGIGDAYNYVSGLAGRSLPYMAAPLAAAFVAPEAAALATVGRVALTAKDLAATAAGGIQFFGSNLSRQLQTGKTAETLDLGQAAAAAPFQAALDTIGFRFIPGLRKIFGEAGVKMTDDELREVMKARMTEGLADKVLSYGTKSLQTAGVEGITETGQQVLERAQAGLNINDPEARKEYFESFIGGAVLGGTLSVPGTALERSSQQGQYEGLMRKDAAAAKEENRKAGVYEKQTGVQQDMFGESTEGFKLPPTPAREAEEKEGDRQNKLFQVTELRDQHDVLMREIDRLKAQFEAPGATDGQKAAILAQADKLNTARADIAQQIKGLSKKLEGAERAGAAPEEGQRGLDFDMPAMPRQKTEEGTVLGDQAAPPAAPTPEQTEFFRQQRVKSIEDRMAAGEMVTPADMAFLQMDAREQRALFEAQPTPQIYTPEEQPDFRLGPQYLQPPIVEPAPAVETRPVTENDFKAMGIGRTNKKLREALLGKDLADPVQRAEVREVLTDFANDPNRSEKIISGVENFLTSPTFMEQGELDLRQPRKPRAKKAKEDTSGQAVVEPTEPIVAATEPSLDVAGQPGPPPAGGFTAFGPAGLGAAPTTTAQPDAGAPVQSTALTIPQTALVESRRDTDEAGTSIEYRFGDNGFAMVRVDNDGRASISNIQIGEEGSTERGKGAGTKAYEAIGNALAAQGATFESTRWSKDRSAISPAALRVWEKLAEAGLARQTGTEIGKVLDRFGGTEKVQEIPTYEFVPAAALEGRKPSTALTTETTDIIDGQVRVIDEETIAPAVAQLAAPEQQTLAEHYGEPVNSPAFLEKLRKDISDFATKGAQAVDRAIRDIIRKLHSAVLAAAVIMNPNFMSAPLPVAIPQTVTTIEQVQAVVPAEVAKNMSPAAQMAFANVFPAIQAELKAKNKFFVLTDKPNARVFIFTADGKPVLDKKVLLGLSPKDFYTGNTDILSNRITPAGLFTLGLRNAARGGGEAKTAGDYDFGKVFVLDKAIDGEYSVTLFHSVWTKEKDAKQRLAALKKEGAEDSRYSYGCINVDKESYKYLLDNYENQMDGAKMFVVPDNPDTTMDFINGKAVDAGDITRQRAEPVMQKVTKTVPGTPSAAAAKTQMAARKEEGVEGSEPTRRSLYRERDEEVAPGEGMRKEKVQAVVDDISKRWDNAPKIEVVQDIQELPQALYQQMVRDNAFDAPGLYDPNTKIVYLIADNIKNRTDAALTLAHEALGHYGLQSILGHTYGKMMDDIYSGNAKVRALADQKIAKGMDQRTAVEEVLAEMAEKNVSNSAVQRVMNAIRQWLRKMGVQFKEVSDTEVRALLANANRFVHGGKFRAGEEAFGNKPLYREGAFDRWFGNSVVRNENGTPKVMYHGTAQDIHEFRAKQAGAIFLTDDPVFAEGFAFQSEEWMQRHWEEFFTPEQMKQFQKEGERIAKREGTDARDETDRLMAAALPSRPNIMPVYVSAQNPFDFDNPAHIKKLKATRTLDATDISLVGMGNWTRIESKEVQDAIKAAGFDGFYVEEGGRKNLAVYDSAQIKSIFNKGSYDPADKRILYRTRKEELTPEGREAEELNERMKGAGNPNESNPDSILKKMLGVVQRPEGGPSLESRIRYEVSDARAPAVEKMQTKFNNTLVDALGNIRGDLAQIQAQEHAALAEGAMEHGGIEINKDGLAEIVDRKATMAQVFDTMTKLGDRLGSLQTAMKLGHNAFIAQRAKEINVHNEKIAKDIVAAEKKGNKAAVSKLTDMLITHHVTDEEIAAGMEAMQKFPELKQAFDTFTEYKNGLIDFLVQTGRISEAKANDWKEAAGYVPWTRVEEETNLFDENPASFKGGVISIAKLPILDRNGSSKEIANIFDNMIGLTSWAVKSGMNAYASRRMVESLPDAFELTTDDAIKYAQKFNKDRLIFTYKDGERTAYLLANPLDRGAFASNIVALGPILKAFSFAQSTLRSFITHMPAFALSQLIQDGTYRAMLLSGVKHPFTLPAKVAKNFIHAMAGEGIPLELARVGVSGVYDGMPQQAMERARVKYGLEERGAFKRGWDKLEKFSLAADLAVRAAIYEQTINETRSPEMPEGDRRLALYRAKEYINFKHGGNSTVVGTLRHMVPFLNAYIQGMDVLYRTMRGKGVSLEDKRTAQKLFLATGLKIAAMSTLYAMLVGDDDDYKGLEGYERDKNYIIPGTGVKIPVAPEVGFMFKVIPERIVQYVVSQGTDRPQDATAFYKGFRDAFITAYSGTNLTPQLIKPALEVAVNYSFFTNNPIVGMGMKNLDPSLQFTEGTSELAKLFGLVGISPMKADYLIRGYTGMLGAFVLDATDAVANPDRMGKPVNKLPQLSTFMYDTTGRGYKSEFYDFRESVDQVVDTVNMFKREGRVQELQEYLTEDKMKLYAMKGVIRKAEETLSNLRKYRNIIANDPQMPPDLKREKTDEILQREKELLLAYNIPKLRGMAGM
jgi:uncharacterized small protein (DUF1192 family)